MVDPVGMRFSHLALAMRPKHWIKNFILLGPLVFSLNLVDIHLVLRTCWAIATFCALSSAVYLFNDVVDRRRDQDHPVKSQRPIARGDVPVSLALTGAGLLLAVALASSFLIGSTFAAIALLYVANNILYSFRLKHFVILDVASIAFGFVLRVFAGTAVIAVEPSSWLIMCTIMLAFFLGFAKRRHELAVLEPEQGHREVLGQYSQRFLDQMIMIAAACSVMSYAMYTVSPKAMASFGSAHLIYTVPFVLLGIFRYLYLIHIRNTGGSPTKVLLTDLPLLITVLLWLAVSVLIVYRV